MTQTGPRSPEAKARVSLNAVKHGLRSERTVIPGRERQADWETFFQDSIADFNPVGAIEYALVERIASLFWRLRRVPRAEVDAVITARDHPAEKESKLHESIAAVLGGVRDELGIPPDFDPAERPSSGPAQPPSIAPILPPAAEFQSLSTAEARLSRQLRHAMLDLSALRAARQAASALLGVETRLVPPALASGEVDEKIAKQ
jgi:hypothetical protein